MRYLQISRRRRYWYAVVVLIAIGLTVTEAIAQTGALPERSEIAEEDKWDLEDMYANDEL
jgi:hypothetical protein